MARYLTERDHTALKRDMRKRRAGHGRVTPRARRRRIVAGKSKPGGSDVIYFELVEDKTYGDATRQARIVQVDGTIDANTPTVYVYDDHNQHYGKTAAGAVHGYRGYAVLAIAAFNGPQGGKPLYRIITMEHPAHLLIVSTNTAGGISQGGGGTKACTVLNQIGRPGNPRLIPASGNVDVGDPFGLMTANSVANEKWVAGWAEAPTYQFYFMLKVGGVLEGIYTDISQSGAVDVDITEIEGYGISLIQGVNDAIPAPPADVRKNAIYRSIGAWLKKLTGYNQSAVMSIGKDAGGDPEWQYDGIC